MNFIDLSKYEVIAYDTETTGLDYPRDEAFGFSISTPDGRDLYFDIRECPDAINWLHSELSYFKGVIACHNASFDYRMSASAGITLPLEQLEDTAIRACCLNEHEATIFPWSRGKLGGYSLDYLSRKYLNEQKREEIYAELAELFGGKVSRKAQMPNLHRAPSEMVAPYACRDTRLTLDLYLSQEKAIEADGIQEIIAFEKKCMPTLIRSEMRGVRVDLDYADEAVHKMDGVVDVESTKLWKLAGGEFNPNSPKQVRAIFECEEIDGEWTARDGTILQRTKSGNPSLDANALRSMRDPVAKQIQELRSHIKTRDTFLKGHIIGSAVNGRVYPNINQMKGEDGGTGTGRLSYTKPALQQIPSRNAHIARIIKQAFLPELGQVWVDADMASFEVRIFAHLVSAYNSAITEAYARNPKMDLHQWVADLMGIPRNATYSGEPNAKQMNLGMIFNQGNGAIADELGMEWEWVSFTDKKGEKVTYKKAGKDAIEVIETYHRKVQGVKQLANRAKLIAETRGYIRTAHGRRLRFPHGYKSYKASGLLIQATSADENKENWLRIEDALGDDGTLILNTHDSYSMSINEDWKPVYERVRKSVERQTLRVPLILDLDGVGKNWAEAKGLV